MLFSLQDCEMVVKTIIDLEFERNSYTIDYNEHGEQDLTFAQKANLRM